MTEPKTLGERAKIVRKEAGKTQAEVAEFLGLAIATWQKIERDEGLPSGETLMSFEKLGVNPGWVLMGLGPKYADPSKTLPPAVQVDPVLMETLYKAVERVYRDMGQKPPPHRIANEAATLFNALLSRVSDVRDKVIVDAVIPALAKELVERLAQAEEAPGTGKRSVS